MTAKLRLWGTLAYASDAIVKREVKEFAKRVGVDPSEVVVERMTMENMKGENLDEKRSSRGGVDGG
mgnify:CR=1 FL=1